MAGNDSNVDQYKDNVIYDGPNIPSEWLLNGISAGSSVVETSSVPSVPVINYSCPRIWGDQSIDAMLRDGTFMPAIASMLPHNLPPLPSDSTDPHFIERAARFSCFSGGSFSEILSPFTFPNSPNPCSRGQPSMPGEVFSGDGLKPSPGTETRNTTEGEFNDEKQTGAEVSANQYEKAEFSGIDAQQNLVAPSVKGVGLKRRKRSKQNHEDNAQADAEKKGNDTVEIRRKNSNPGGKEETKELDSTDEGYIHVRARRGQATNSHSLAERIRREKISVRMKHLQALVPGCNKVTGKAVMLDEIINYVQSLQRQVEFLSMKLATVNPQVDILQSGAGLSSLLACQPDVTMPFPPQ